MAAIRRHDRSDDWWIDFRYSHRRIRRRSPVQSKQGAERYERVLRNRFLLEEERGGDPLGGDLTTFADFVARWMVEYSAAKNRPATQRSAGITLRVHLLPELGHLTLSNISEACVDRLIAKLRKKGCSPKTTNNILSTLRKILSCAVKWGVLSHVPAISLLRAPLPSYTFLSVDDCQRLVAAAKPGYWRALIVFFLHTGCRFGEAAALRWEDLELDGPNPRVRIQRGVSLGIVGPTKNGRVRDIPLTPDVIRELKSLPQIGPYVFALVDGSLPCACHARHHLIQMCKKAGIKQVSWHVLRHTFATELSERQVPLRVVQDLLGHTSIVMTARYAHVADRSLQAAVTKLPSFRGREAIAA